MNHVLKLLIIVVFVFLAGYFLEGSIDISPDIKDSLENYLEISAELISVFISISIFSITWHAYTKSRDNHSLFLGAAFLVTGSLILLHAFSNPFMPFLITPNTTSKSAFFFLESRIIFAILFLASAYISKDALPELINKYTLTFYIIILSVISLVLGLLYRSYLLPGYDPAEIHSNVNIMLLSTIIIVFASYSYIKKYEETGQKNFIFLIYGSIIIAFSNLVYFFHEISGHLFIIAGYFFMYLALYKSSIELPYENLALLEEKLLNAAEDRYREVFNNASDAISTIDPDARITSWNPASEKIFGWKAQEATGKDISLIVPRNEQALKYKDMIVKCVLSGRSISGVDLVYQHKDGREVNVNLAVFPLRDTNQNIIGMSAIMRDFTEHRLKEEKIRKEKEFAAHLLKGLKDAFAVIDKDGKQILVNDELCKITGFSEKELVNQYPPFKYWAEEGLQRIYEAFEKTIKGIEDEYDLIFKRKDGERFIARVSPRKTTDPDGDLIFFVTIKDIIEHKKQKNYVSKMSGSFSKPKQTQKKQEEN